MSSPYLRSLLAGLVLCFAAGGPCHAEDVMVFAAASLTNALNDIAEQFSAKTGTHMSASYAASSALAKQIEQGAPAQIFASADLKWMDYLVEKKLVVADSRINLLGNRLVLVAPADSKLDKMEITPKTDIAALAGNGRISTGDPDSVPVGLYFRQAMERSGQWAAIEPKLARADSVRAALAQVERGEAPLGVVYATDAAISRKVKVVGVFPESMHDFIVYPFALVTGKDSAAAKGLLAYLSTNDAKAVWVRYGFKVN